MCEFLATVRVDMALTLIALALAIANFRSVIAFVCDLLAVP